MARLNQLLARQTLGSWLASLMLACTLLLLGASLLGYQSHISTVDKAKNALRAELDTASRRLNQDLASTTLKVRYISTLNSLVEFASGDESRRADAEQALHQLLSINDTFVQARVINGEGFETLRLERESEGLIFTKPLSELQDKSSRYYVQAGLKLFPEQSLVSQIDFNIENGKLERPLRPVMRVVAPIYGGKTTIRGVLVVNYAMSGAMQLFQDRVVAGDADTWLISNEGHWLFPANKHPPLLQPDRVSANFREQLPLQWSHLHRLPYVQFADGSGWSVSRPITVPRNSLTAPAELEQLGWLIARIPSHVLAWTPSADLSRWKWVLSTLVIIAAVLCFFLVTARHRSLQTQRLNSEQKEKLKLSGVIFENTAEGLIVTDPDQTIMACNEAATRITGYKEQEMTGKTPRLWASRKHDKEYYEEIWRQLEHTGHWQGELVNRRKNGELFTALENISAVYDEKGQITNYIAIMADISDLKKSQAQLHKLAYHDTLTQLPNRRLFRENLDRLIATHQRQEAPFALALMDLDNFKVINDSLGHAVGDLLLQRIAVRLKDMIRPQDSLSRLGGDEFGLLLAETGSSSAISASIQRILNALQEPIDIDGREIRPQCSIGIAIFPNDADTADDLLKAADAAMYATKAKGRNSYSFHTPRMNEQATRRLEMEHQLRQALTDDLLELYYQPQVRLDSGQIVGMEALLRWHHPHNGLMSAAEFIPVAEETGLIHDLGNWVWRSACQQASEWEARDFEDTRIAINISGHQLTDASLPTQIINTVRRDPAIRHHVSIELEMTESMLMSAPRLITLLDQFRAAGIKLALDDFGTGYSSLSQLRRLPVNRLKIAGSFIRDMLDDHESMAIVRSIVHLGTDLGLTVLAEEVEHEDQKNALIEMGCHEAQGFYFYRPMSASAVEEMLLERSRRSE